MDILIPASVTDVINDKNKNDVKAKIIVEGANIPMSEDIERELSDRGILIVPDFVANSGGVVSSYAEYRGYDYKKCLSSWRKRLKMPQGLFWEKVCAKKKTRAKSPWKLPNQELSRQ